jgi:ThiF family
VIVLEASQRRRDDRTERVIQGLVGDRLAPLAHSHFRNATVRVSATPATLSMPNGYLAFATAANMITRFVWSLELVVPKATGDVEAALEHLLTELRSIDSREGKRIACVHTGSLGENPAIVQLHLGEGSPDLGGEAHEVIWVSFDSWGLSLSRGRQSGTTIGSVIPFGGLAAACFGVAEVFKSILVQAAEGEALGSTFRGRLVKEYEFSTWYAEGARGAEQYLRATQPPPALPALSVGGLLQVGAGAVGNGSVLAFSALEGLVGVLPLFDSKTVDVKNLNRCLYFREADVGCPKVEVVSARASRRDLRIDGRNELFRPGMGGGAWLYVSTVDNNDVRHVMQEALPKYVVQGATSSTNVAVSVHTGVDGASCLICRHPERAHGLIRQVPLSIDEAATRIGMPAEVVLSSQFHGSGEISREFIARVKAADPDAAEFFEGALATGHDLCGAIGDFRTRYGFTIGPEEPSVPFASVFGGVQAAAEAVKLLLREAGAKDVPVLDNVLEIDFAFDYTRYPRLAFREPARGDCAFCRDRSALAADVYNRKWGARGVQGGT